MKNIVEHINESLMDTKMLSGARFVNCQCKDPDFKESIKATGWMRVAFSDNGSDVIAYWTPNCEWIFYYYVNDAKQSRFANRPGGPWAAVSPDVYSMKQFNITEFSDFNTLCMEGATIGEFDEFETDLE